MARVPKINTTSKKEIIEILSNIFDDDYKFFYPEKFISRMGTRPANLPILRWLEQASYDSSRFDIPDYTKFAHANTLELPSVFSRNQFKKDKSGKIIPIEEEYEQDYGVLPSDIWQYSDIEILNPELQRSLSDLMRELAAIRNPQGVIAYRLPQYTENAQFNPKRMGVLSMTKDPILMVEEAGMQPVIPYLIKPKQLLSDFTESPWGFPYESEVQTFAPFGAKRLGPAITDYDKLQAYVRRTQI
jgi:hypothetical protein